MPRYFPVRSIAEDVIQNVAGHMPRLKKLDLTGLNADSSSIETRHALSVILRGCRNVLADVGVDLAAGYVVDAVCEANLIAVKCIRVRHGPGADALRLLPLLHSLKDRRDMSSNVETLVVRTKEGLPMELRGEAVACAAPGVRKVEYEEVGGGCGELVRFVGGWKELDEVIVKDGIVDIGGLVGLKCTFGFVGCVIGGLLEGVGVKVIRLEMSNEIGVKEMKVLEGMKEVVELGLKVSGGCVYGLEGVFKEMKGLRSLTLAVLNGGGEDVRRGVMRGLRAIGEEFCKLVVQGVSLTVEDLKELFETGGERWEYLVTGIWGPRRSRSECIMELLQVVRTVCRGFKVLCFGLDLRYDERARELDSKLRKAIEECGKACEGLDTVWLKRNADSLLSIPRPDGWSDGWIEGAEGEEA